MALIGDLSLTMEDGTVLRDRTDLGLAEQWAKATVGAEVWELLRYGERVKHTAEALLELRRAVQD